MCWRGRVVMRSMCPFPIFPGFSPHSSDAPARERPSLPSTSGESLPIRNYDESPTSALAFQFLEQFLSLLDSLFVFRSIIRIRSQSQQRVDLLARVRIPAYCMIGFG